MDYSLLLAIETLSETEYRRSNALSIHQIGANRTSRLLKQGNEYKEVEICDVRELMSRKHCFISGERVYHFAVIDYLQQWNF